VHRRNRKCNGTNQWTNRKVLKKRNGLNNYRRYICQEDEIRAIIFMYVSICFIFYFTFIFIYCVPQSNITQLWILSHSIFQMLDFSLLLYCPVAILHHYLLQYLMFILNFTILLVHLGNFDPNSHLTLSF